MIVCNQISNRCRHTLKPGLWLCLLLFKTVTGLWGQVPQDTLVLGPKNGFTINEHLYYYKTPKTCTPYEVFYQVSVDSFKKLYPETAINSGFSNDYYWMIFTLKNPFAAEKDLFFQFNNPYLNVIQIWKKTPTGFGEIAHTGSTLPFNTRPYTYHDFVLPIRLGAGEVRTLLIMADKRGEIFSAKPQLMDANTFKDKEQKLYLMFGVIIGIMLFNIVINLFLGVSLKDGIHFLYALYICAALLWLFSSMGVDFQYFYPDTPALIAIAQPITGGITMILMAQLAIVFLQLGKGRSWVKLLLNTGKYTAMIQTPFWYIIYHRFYHLNWLKQLQSNLFLVAISCIAVGMIAAAIERIRQGYKPAWFYLAAILYLAFGIFKTCFIILGSRDISELISPPTAVQQGLMIESIIIFIGIIYRYNTYKGEREKLQIKLSEQRIEMMQQIVAAQEEERKRLAQDLHDDVGATLSTLLLHITNVPDTPEWGTPFVRSYSERGINIAQKALGDLRLISHDLVPKDFALLGLFHVLRNKIEELNQIGNIKFWINAEGDDKGINDIFSITIYRIINELINNIVKHAIAANATIDISIGETHITVIIEDDGIGWNAPYNSSDNGIGLRNIRSRVDFLNGAINIDGNKNGTTVIVEIPLNQT